MYRVPRVMMKSGRSEAQIAAKKFQPIYIYLYFSHKYGYKWCELWTNDLVMYPSSHPSFLIPSDLSIPYPVNEFQYELSNSYVLLCRFEKFFCVNFIFLTCLYN